MKKGSKYKCYIPWEHEEWVFEIITLTDKTCKLQQIEKWYFDYVSRFMKDKEKRIITLRINKGMKDFIKEDFVKYDRSCWLPFVFELID